MIGVQERGPQQMQAEQTERFSSLRPQDIKDLSARVDLGREQLQDQMQASLNHILNEQHPTSHLFPAATAARQDKDNHYQDTWVRDNSMIGLALFDPLILKQYPKGERTGDRIRSSGTRLIEGMLDLFGQEPWKSGFEQEVEEGDDPYGRSHRYLTREAPPIHFKIDSTPCSWPTQNQPDSWGEFLMATGKAVKQGAIELDQKQSEVLNKIADYVIHLGLDRNFKYSSMWEWGEVYRPTSLSTLALCAAGLGEISPYLNNSREQARVEAQKLQTVVSNLYPTEYTVPDGHVSKTDLATLVAFSVGALNGHSFGDYADVADLELGNGEHPGKKRYIGDHYQRTDQEAIWPMGTIMEAKVLLESAQPQEAMSLREKGLSSLRKAKMVYDRFGYSPELLKVENGIFVPSKNHLLWNEALMAQACSRALVLV